MTASWVDDVLAAQAAIDARHAAARGRTVGESESDPIAVIRFRWAAPAGGPLDRRYDVQAYTDRYQRVPLDRATQAYYVAGLWQRWPYAVQHGDWDYLVADGRLVRTPEVYELGGIPEDDLCFSGAHTIPNVIGAAA